MGFKDKNKTQQGIWKMQISIETREKSKQSWIAGPLEASWSCSINTVTQALLLNRSLWSPFSRLYLPGPGLKHPPHPLMALRGVLISFPRRWTPLLHDSMKQNLFSSLLLLPKTDKGFDKGENTYKQLYYSFLLLSWLSFKDNRFATMMAFPRVGNSACFTTLRTDKWVRFTRRVTVSNITQPDHLHSGAGLE